MTRKKAIEAWDKWMEYGYSHSAMPNSMALVMAYNALRGPTREQVEQIQGTWIPVMESEITGFDPEFAGRDPIGGYKCSRCNAEAVLDCNDEYVLSDFCYGCGAPMTGEAVDVMLKRLEVMKDENRTD